MSAAAEMARAEADEVEAAEAAEADTPDDEAAEADADEQPSSNVSVDKALAQMEKENARHATAVAKIMGEDFALVYPCTHCEDFAAGFTFTPPEESGKLKRAAEFQTCEKCDGEGQVDTGAKKTATWHTTCRGCNGQGYIEVPLPPTYAAPDPVGVPTNAANAATNVDAAMVNALIAAGYMVLPPASPPPTV